LPPAQAGELNVPEMSIPLAVPLIVAGQLPPYCGVALSESVPFEMEPLTGPKKPPSVEEAGSTLIVPDTLEPVCVSEISRYCDACCDGDVCWAEPT
jgi:hypothetical protein